MFEINMDSFQRFTKVAREPGVRYEPTTILARTNKTRKNVLASIWHSLKPEFDNYISGVKTTVTQQVTFNTRNLPKNRNFSRINLIDDYKMTMTDDRVVFTW